jgi:hypothetical protein
MACVGEVTRPRDKLVAAPSHHLHATIDARSRHLVEQLAGNVATVLSSRPLAAGRRARVSMAWHPRLDA